MTAIVAPMPVASRIPIASLDSHALLLAELQSWVDHGWLRSLDWVFAEFLSRKQSNSKPLLLLAAALASHQLGRGHACLDLRATLADPDGVLALTRLDVSRTSAASMAPRRPSDLLSGVDLVQWQQALEGSDLVSNGHGATPLVNIGARLYLRRYWQYEQSVSAAILLRVSDRTAAATPQAQKDVALALNVLFPARAAQETLDWQKVACALAARQRFSIVTGGPGTGKTTTVVRLLALLQYLSLSGDENRKLRIRLAAPTGKAAARLNESIAGAVATVPLEGLVNAEAVRAAIPTAATTVHRLLGTRPGSRRFSHDAQQPLALDVLVIDEASMLDLEMMAAVLAALPPTSSLVLLGDKDQLASVDAGAVLGDLCRRADSGHFLPETVAWLQATTGATVPAEVCDTTGEALDQAVVKLRVSHRFSADSGIGRLADAVNRTDHAGVRSVFSTRHPDVARLHGDDVRGFARLVIDGLAAGDSPKGFKDESPALRPAGYRRYLESMRAGRPNPNALPAAFDRWALDVLEAYSRFQLLCAVRKGPQGVEGLNQLIESLLREENLLAVAHGGWYPGRPVMVTRNDYDLGLMNGDVGVAMEQPIPSTGLDAQRWTLRVAFQAGDGREGIRWVLPSRLRAVETVYAMTVHKSQGSEFAHAALVLPNEVNRMLTRELVYTGITRAKQWLTLVASDVVLQGAISKSVERVGNLWPSVAEA